jgi:hypothetical protein
MSTKNSIAKKRKIVFKDDVNDFDCTNVSSKKRHDVTAKDSNLEVSIPKRQKRDLETSDDLEVSLQRKIKNTKRSLKLETCDIDNKHKKQKVFESANDNKDDNVECKNDTVECKNDTVECQNDTGECENDIFESETDNVNSSSRSEDHSTNSCVNCILLNRDSWKDISIYAQTRLDEALDIFDKWSVTKDANETFEYQPLLRPKMHLTVKTWSLFKRHAKKKGFGCKRKVLPESMKLSNDRKAKMYFVLCKKYKKNTKQIAQSDIVVDVEVVHTKDLTTTESDNNFKNINSVETKLIDLEQTGVGDNLKNSCDVENVNSSIEINKIDTLISVCNEVS